MVQPSIQQFYQQVPSTPPQSDNKKLPLGTDDDVVAESPVARTLVADEDLSDSPCMSDLIPGPGRLTLVGRVIGILHRASAGSSAETLRAKGHWKLCIKDGTAAVTVILYYKAKQYSPTLGQLVRVRVSHLSNGNSKVSIFDSTSLFATIFPERDNACAFQVLADTEICRQPIELKANHLRSDLTLLKSFIGGDHELPKSIILVCVKSVGPKFERSVKNKSGQERKASVTEVRVLDQSGDAVISFWDALASAPAKWLPNETVLIIYSAAWNEYKSRITIRDNTYIDVNPDCIESDQLKAWVLDRLKVDRVTHMEPPASTFDVEEGLSGQQRVLFSIAMIDEWARAAPPGAVIMGYFSLIILELNICRLRVNRQLCYSQCCGIPIYSNAIHARCKQCERSVELRLNPALVGILLDETGSIAPGQLLWSDRAWEELFGCHPHELVQHNSKELRSLESRMLHMRLTFFLGWEKTLQKLSVLSVMA